VEDGPQERDAWRRRLLGVELHADGATAPDDGRKAIVLMGAPRRNDALIMRAAGIRVRVVRVAKLGSLDERLMG
jgi:hypothetical protein